MRTETGYYLGVEIGGTKLQVAVGQPDHDHLVALQRTTVDPSRGAEGIRAQLESLVPRAISESGIPRAEIRGAGIGFGGPIDSHRQSVIRSHQISGWDDYPLADWFHRTFEIPATLANDADVAGLAESVLGNGKGHRHVFYITLGSGIGGGLIIDQRIYRGAGRGAAEIGQLLLPVESSAGLELLPLEKIASGWGMEDFARRQLASFPHSCLQATWQRTNKITVADLAAGQRAGDELCSRVFSRALKSLALAIGHVIALLCPEVIVIGGGVSNLGDQLFRPLRTAIDEIVFPPFAGLTEIRPAHLGEPVVLHGAILLAAQGLVRS